MMEISDVLAYLEGDLGLRIAAEEWEGAPTLPVYLDKGARYWLCTCSGVTFLTAVMTREETLPVLKRTATQVAQRSDLPVVLVAQIDSRQRRALVMQQIPFVVPGTQAFLPFLGFVASSARPPRSLGATLTPSAQAALVCLIANPHIRSAGELISTTGMSTTSSSRALDELARRGLVTKSKNGREIIVTRPDGKNELLKNAMSCLQTPVVQTIYVRKSPQVDKLPRAGESGLAERTMLVGPRIDQRAISRRGMNGLDCEHVVLGELPDSETVELQVWRYEPLVAGGQQIDEVSLALSVVDRDDERINGEVNALFEEDLWL